MAGPVDIDPAKPHAFLSYTRFDDKALNGDISALREALEVAVQALTGEPFDIFQDVEDIKPGDAWRKKLDRAIEAAQLFIPILTPSFFTSDFCKREAQAFLDYEARAGRDDLVLPIYLIDTPKLNDADQRAADEIASRLHERQYANWRPLRFKLQDDNTRPRIDELAGAIASAIARNGKATLPPSEPALPKGVMDRLAALEGRLEERDQTIVAEQAKRERAESALSTEKAKSRELAEAPSGFEGQVEEARKREAELQSEIESLKQGLVKYYDRSQQLGERIERDAVSIPRSFFLGGAVLALLVGAGGWMAGQGGSLSSNVEQLGQQNLELTSQLERQAAELEKAQKAAADLQASATAAQDNDDDVADQIYQPLSTFKDCADCPEMVVIPAGSFEMGSPEDEVGRRDNEGPLHPVTIETPFALGKYEVTRGQFSHFVSATGHEATGCSYVDDKGWKIDTNHDWRDPGYEQTDAHPVACVSWDDAKAYVEWLSNVAGETYRLPSEAEWEYAARAGTKTRYYWGDDTESGCTSANVYDVTSKTQNGFSSTAFPCDDGYVQTAPVGSFRTNAFGLHDVSSNVWEWVEDRWHESYDGASADGSAKITGIYSYHIQRGGSWSSYPEVIRSAFRGWAHPGVRSNDYGFRLARTLTP